MELKKRTTNLFWSSILILCLSRVCHGQLMCYVCDNCAQITAATPQFECNKDFFNSGGPTDSSVQTTTDLSKTTAADTNDTMPADVTTLTPSTTMTQETTATKTTAATTESKTSESTPKLVTENTTETLKETSASTPVSETTQEAITTTEDQPSVPTTSKPDSLSPIDDIETLKNQTIVYHEPVGENDSDNGTIKPYKPSAEFRVRQLRSIGDVTFYCFKIESTVNRTMVVNRGCSRAPTSESVCSQWESQHPGNKLNKCYTCSNTKCNGSSALSGSITALFVAVVAVLMHRK